MFSLMNVRSRRKMLFRQFRKLIDDGEGHHTANITDEYRKIVLAKI